MCVYRIFVVHHITQTCTGGFFLASSYVRHRPLGPRRIRNGRLYIYVYFMAMGETEIGFSCQRVPFGMFWVILPLLTTHSIFGLNNVEHGLTMGY